MPDENQLISIEDPFPEEKPNEQPQQLHPAGPDDETEPDGVVEVAPGRRMVDVSVVAAERKRARELAEKNVREKELAPLQERANRADALQQALDAVKPYIERLQQQPPQAQPAPEASVSDDEAAQEARDLQLYTKDSTLDIATAKKIIARRRAESKAAAREAAHEAVTPFAKQTAETKQQQNFAAMVQELGADDILTPKELAQQFVELGPELSQHPEVAKVALERAVGQAYLKRRGRSAAAPQREPVMSEAPGGRITQDITLTDTGRKMGLTKDDLKESAKTSRPGDVSPIGSW